MYSIIMDLESDQDSSWLEIENEVNEQLGRAKRFKVKSYSLFSCGVKYKLAILVKKKPKYMLDIEGKKC